MTQLILLVDDQIEASELLIYTLQKKGFVVDTVSSGMEAIGYLKNEIPRLVILDFVMPEMDGTEVLQQIRENHDKNTLPVLMLTAKSCDFDREMSLANGANKFLSKFQKISEIEKSIYHYCKVDKQTV
jgi:DNA-binding response OmpR family regulator